MSAFLTYLGGPTAMIEWDSYRILTDPVFDDAPAEYPFGPVTLRKTMASGLRPYGIDLVLLSHDQHPDNLDHRGREVLHDARVILTTAEAAARLGPPAVGLDPFGVWSRGPLAITGTPAQHGPLELLPIAGPVTGFLLTLEGLDWIYFTGDTIWFEGLEEVARRFRPRYLVPFAGAARVPQLSPSHVTLTAAETLRLAEAFPQSTVIPLHYEGWHHFSEGSEAIRAEFEQARLGHRLLWPPLGQPVALLLPSGA